MDRRLGQLRQHEVRREVLAGGADHRVRPADADEHGLRGRRFHPGSAPRRAVLEPPRRSVRIGHRRAGRAAGARGTDEAVRPRPTRRGTRPRATKHQPREEDRSRRADTDGVPELRLPTEHLTPRVQHPRPACPTGTTAEFNKPAGRTASESPAARGQTQLARPHRSRRSAVVNRITSDSARGSGVRCRRCTPVSCDGTPATQTQASSVKPANR